MSPAIPVRASLESIDVAMGAEAKIEALASAAEAEGTDTGTETATALRAFVAAMRDARRYGRAGVRGLELALRRSKGRRARA